MSDRRPVSRPVSRPVVQPVPRSDASAGEDPSVWMAAYQAGQSAAFERLYHALAPRLRGYLISLTASVPRAEDLLQETFLQIHRSRHTYTPPRPVAPWAFGIARHVYLMDCRAWARRQRLETEQDSAGLDLSVAPLGEKVADRGLRLPIGTAVVCQVGKRKFARITVVLDNG